MTWRIAKSLEKLRSQINAKYPKRDKSSDGTIGDAAHASRSSDHNPWVKDGKTGVVTGMDITNDPKNGMASGDLAEALLASRDPRIKYVISNARICSGDAGPSPWVWRKYSGANAHRHHVHLSVKADKKFYDSVKPWSFAVKAAKFVEPVATIEEPEEAEIEENAAPVFEPTALDIRNVQQNLLKLGYHEVGVADGLWGAKTAAGIAAYKTTKGMPGAAVIDPDLIDALSKEQECRLVPLDRANVTAKDIAPTTPAVRQTLMQRLGAKIVGIGAAGGVALEWLKEEFYSVREYVQPFTSFFRDVPGWVWGVGLVAGAVALYISANKATESIVHDKRTNRLN